MFELKINHTFLIVNVQINQLLGLQKYRISKQMTPSQTLLIALLLILGNSQYYQLDFDWILNRQTVGIEYGYVQWNNRTVATLKELDKASTLHHAKVNLTFAEGNNLLSFFFEGKNGELTIGNVAITRPPKTINLLANGDFGYPRLDSTETTKTFTTSIVGWSGSEIEMTKQSSLNTLSGQALLLNSINKNIFQKVTFGKVDKYSFISLMNYQIQVMTNVSPEPIYSKTYSPTTTTSYSTSTTSGTLSTSTTSGTLSTFESQNVGGSKSYAMNSPYQCQTLSFSSQKYGL